MEGSFMCFRFIPVRHRLEGSFMCVRSIAVRPGGLRVRLGAFGRFPCAVGVFGFVRVRSFHSCCSWVSFGNFRSIPVRR